MLPPVPLLMAPRPIPAGAGVVVNRICIFLFVRFVSMVACCACTTAAMHVQTRHCTMPTSSKKNYVKVTGVEKHGAGVMIKTEASWLKFRGHSVDPKTPIRAWYFAQVSGTMTKDWDVNGQYFPATNRPIESAPEAHSIEWTADGKVKCAHHCLVCKPER